MCGGWVHTVLLIVLHLTDTTGDASTILIITDNTFLTHLCKSCADVTQLYDSNISTC